MKYLFLNCVFLICFFTSVVPSSQANDLCCSISGQTLTPILDIDFNHQISLIAGEGTVRFERSSPQGYFDENGLLQEAPENTPIFDPETGWLILSGNHGSHTVNLDFSVPDSNNPTLPARWNISVESGDATVARATQDPPGGVLQHYLDITSTSSGVALIEVPTVEIYNNDHYNGFYISAWIKGNHPSLYGKVRAISSDGSVRYWYNGSDWSTTEGYFLVSDGTEVSADTWTRVHERLQIRPTDTAYTQIMGYRVPVTTSNPVKLTAVDFTAMSLAPPLRPTVLGSPRNSSPGFIKIQQQGNIDKTKGTIVIDMEFVEADGNGQFLAENNINLLYLDDMMTLYKEIGNNRWVLSDWPQTISSDFSVVNEMRMYGAHWNASTGIMGSYVYPGAFADTSFDGLLGNGESNTDIILSVGNLVSVKIRQIRIYQQDFVIH